MVHTAHLADHEAAIPTLAHWFRETWPDHFGRHSHEDVEREFRDACSRDRLPIALVAYTDGRLAGTIAVREHALSSQPEGPGLGGLYVLPIHRKGGIGTLLVQAGAAEAKRLGHTVIYTGTSTAQRLLGRLGWHELRTVRHGGENVTLFRFDL